MLIYVNIRDRQTDRQTRQKYSSEPHKIQKKLIFFYKWSIIIVLGSRMGCKRSGLNASGEDRRRKLFSRLRHLYLAFFLMK